MITIKDNTLKIDFNKFKIEFIKNIPFLILCFISIPFLYYFLDFLMVFIKHIILCVFYSIPTLYNAHPFYKLMVLFIFIIYLFDICIIYKLFPNYKLFDILYDENTETLYELRNNINGIIPISFFILFNVFYLIGFWSTFDGAFNFLNFCLFAINFICTSFCLIILVITVICNIMYFLDIIKIRYLK